MINFSYTLRGRNIEASVAEFVRNFNLSAYESRYKGGFLRIFEDSSFWNKNNYMVIIRVDTNDKDDGIIRIEVISGGADDKLLVGSIFGGDKRRIKEFPKSLQKFCEERHINCVADEP